MRTLVLIISGIGTILTAAAAQAQTYDPNYPVCLQSCALGGCKIECDYTSLAQCICVRPRGAMLHQSIFCAWISGATSPKLPTATPLR